MSEPQYQTLVLISYKSSMGISTLIFYFIIDKSIKEQ